MTLQKKSTGNTIIGLLLILFGLSLFLSNFEIIGNVRGILFSWQAILMVVGIILFVNHKDSGTGLILLTIGSIGLIAKLNHTSMKFIFKEYWPAFLIILGIYILFNKGNCKPRESKKHFDNQEPNINVDEL